MSLLNIFIIALVQGITEFLPISSAAHLILVPILTGFPDQGLLIDISVHFGTLLAVSIYFYKDIFTLFRGAFDILTFKSTEAAQLVWRVIIATIPVVILGYIAYKVGIDAFRTIRVLGWTTLIFGIFLGLVDYFVKPTREYSEMTRKDAIIIGFFQTIALIPGVSRSGITMTAGRLLGFNSYNSAHFSLLISIPTILGASLLAFIDIVKVESSIFHHDVLIGVGLTFIAAYITIAIMMRWLANHSFLPFVIYRIILGSLMLYMGYFSHTTL